MGWRRRVPEQVDPRPSDGARTIDLIPGGSAGGLGGQPDRVPSEDKAGLGLPGGLLGDAVLSAQNALKLGVSLAATWAIALVVRLALPRFLGPAGFGVFQFADYFTAAFFVVSTLGVDTYIRKEVSLRPGHASDFFGGLLAVRLVLSALAVGGMLAALHLTGKDGPVRKVVLLFSVYQFLLILGTTYGALLHAAGRIDGLAVLNVASKLFWAAGVAIAIRVGSTNASAFALALVASEAAKTVALTWLVRRTVGLRFRIRPRETRAALAASLPFYVSGLTGVLYAVADVSLMAFLASDVEVGWYGAAVNLTVTALVLVPILHLVVLPMASRALARSAEEFRVFGVRALELIVSLSTPVALFSALGADLVVTLLFGEAFGPAARGFRVLSAVIFLTYVAVVASLLLIRLERGWTVTLVSLGVLGLNLALNWLGIPWGARHLGPGGAGVASAGAWLVSEAFNVVALLALLGAHALDRRSGVVIAKTAAVCLITVAAHALLEPLGLARLPACAAIYVALILGSGAVSAGEVARFARLVREHRGSEPSPVDKQ